MNILSDLKRDIRELILPALGQEVPLAVSEVIEAIWSEERRPQVNRKKKTDLGWEFHFALPAGISFRDFANRQEYFRDRIGSANVEMVRSGKMAVMRVITQQLKSKYLYDWNYPRQGILPIPIGYTHNGLIVADLADIPHVLIGGVTGGGKSNAIHVIVNSLIHAQQKPEIILIDLKMVDYNYLEDHIMLVTDHEMASQSITRLVAEMRRRLKLLKESKCVNVKKYNKKNPDNKLKYIVLVIDELSELDDEKAQENMEVLLRLCRASAICVLAATQHPDRFTFKHFSTTKAQFRGRLGFACSDAIGSRIILDNSMAADLPDIPGRAVWRLGSESIVLQTPYLDPEEAERRLEGESSSNGLSKR